MFSNGFEWRHVASGADFYIQPYTNNTANWSVRDYSNTKILELITSNKYSSFYGPVKPGTYTAAQRIALTGLTAGHTVFDSDSARNMQWTGSAWKGIAFTDQLGSSSSGTPSSETLVTPNDANYTITTGTGNLAVVYFNTLTAERTVTLPDPATNTGRLFSIKHGGDGAFNLNLSVPIYENASTYIVSIAPGAWINFMSDGTQFIKIR
jgi:hypothetical protein